MKFKVLYFASLREALGVGQEIVEAPAAVCSVATLRSFLAARGDGVAALAPGRNVRAAVNQQMVAGDAPIAEGDEVAFFPPVTGG